MEPRPCDLGPEGIEPSNVRRWRDACLLTSREIAQVLRHIPDLGLSGALLVPQRRAQHVAQGALGAGL